MLAFVCEGMHSFLYLCNPSIGNTVSRPFFCCNFVNNSSSYMATRRECTPNMHLFLHLKDSITDYGQVHSFWCLAFERFSGVLGSYHTNKCMFV